MTRVPSSTGSSDYYSSIQCTTDSGEIGVVVKFKEVRDKSYYKLSDKACVSNPQDYSNDEILICTTSPISDCNEDKMQTEYGKFIGGLSVFFVVLVLFIIFVVITNEKFNDL